MHFIDFGKLWDQLTFIPDDPLLFSTVLFLFLVTGALFIYRLLQSFGSARIYFLLLFSFYFYYKVTGELLWVLILIAVINYAGGYLLLQMKSAGMRRFAVFLTAALNLIALGYFKYTNFLLETISGITGGEFDALDIILPIGISFYVFKGLSYIFDIYFEKITEPAGLRDFILYMAFFPNVLAGPIDRAVDFLPQIKREEPLTKAEMGRATFLLMSGLFKKAIIADYISINFVDRIFDVPLRFTGVENLIGVYGYALQIYFDFSGYTDMALGIALLFGFKLTENFNFPYKAAGVADFWRRWHISLSSWLLDYLFTPMQLSMRKFRVYGNALALFITFVLCGIWHGSEWTFVLWGTLHGFFMVYSLLLNDWRKKIAKKSNPVMWAAVTGTIGIVMAALYFLSGIPDSLVASVAEDGVLHYAGYILYVGFAITGLVFAARLLIGKYKLQNKWYIKLGQIVITFHLISFVWIFFRADSFEKVWSILSQIFTFFKPEVFVQFFEGYDVTSGMILLGFIISFLPTKLPEKLQELAAKMPLVMQALSLAVMIYIVSQVRFSDLAPFIYFQF